MLTLELPDMINILLLHILYPYIIKQTGDEDNSNLSGRICYLDLRSTKFS